MADKKNACRSWKHETTFEKKENLSTVQPNNIFVSLQHTSSMNYLLFLLLSVNFQKLQWKVCDFEKSQNFATLLWGIMWASPTRNI